MDETTWRRCLVGLGSNLGDRLAHLRAAVAALRDRPDIRAVRASAVYQSPAMGPVPQGDYLNAAVALETVLDPASLLAVALSIERRRGRVREVRWGPRTLDIDLLWMDGVTAAGDGLTLPHPGLAERPFVLRPVAELMPELRLPDGRLVAAAVEELSADDCVPVPGADLDR